MGLFCFWNNRSYYLLISSFCQTHFGWNTTLLNFFDETLDINSVYISLYLKNICTCRERWSIFSSSTAYIIEYKTGLTFLLCFSSNISIIGSEFPMQTDRQVGLLNLYNYKFSFLISTKNKENGKGVLNFLERLIEPKHVHTGSIIEIIWKQNQIDLSVSAPLLYSYWWGSLGWQTNPIGAAKLKFAFVRSQAWL